MDLDKRILEQYGKAMSRLIIPLKEGEPEAMPDFYGRCPPAGFRNETDTEYRARHLATMKEALR